MKDRVLLSVTQVTDDSTGLYEVGELDFSIHVGPLMDYMKKNPSQSRAKLFNTLGTLMVQVDRYMWECLNESGVTEKRDD